MRRITLLIDSEVAGKYHSATLDALQHAIDASGRDVVVDVTPTDEIYGLGDGIIAGPGTPYRDPRAVEDVITEARARGVPLVAT